MTSLRTVEGLNVEFVTNRFSEKAASKLKQEANQFIETGKMQWNNGHLQLTKEGKLFADGIAAELFTTQPLNRWLALKFPNGTPNCTKKASRFTGTPVTIDNQRVTFIFTPNDGLFSDI